MIIELLLFALLQSRAQTPDNTDQDLRRQQQQLDQMHTQLQKVEDLLDKSQREPKPGSCSAELRWITGGQDMRVPANAAAVAPLNLFSTVSRPLSACLPAEIRIAASYLDAAENLICTGIVENIAVQNNLTQSVNLDIRPWNVREFVRWRNEPPEVNSGAKRLVCVNPEGTAEATNEDLARVASVHVRATVLPANGGMSGVEINLKLR